MSLKTVKVENDDISSTAPDNLESNSLANEKNDLSELRRLIVQSDEVSEVLPSAIAKSSQKDNQLVKATLPIVEENIRQSVIRNPDILAEALFPAIGPTIRKAISEALSQMIQSLNQTLENSFSPKGLKWRFEAWQTGKPFAEVVLLHSLIYRVEEVFLIHRETGGLLQHVSAQKNVSQDADMVSAMLTAIQDFAHDSFVDSENATLDSLKLNELSVWIERSPDAIVAGVIRGNPPLTLREIFKEAIEAIQFVQREEFENFDGDTTKFEKSRPMLDNCLQFQLNSEETKKKKLLTPARILAFAALLFLLICGAVYFLDYWRWSSYLTRLKNEPGIVVTQEKLGWFKDSVEGLRDPLAINPEEILGEYNLKKENIESNWKPYQDLSPAIVLARANKILQPPNGAALNFADGILTVYGKVSDEWIADAKKLSPVIAGVNEFRLGQDALKSKIESQNIYFVCNTVDYTEKQAAKIPELIRDLELLADSSKNLQIEIRGQADLTGTEKINSELSQKRADKMLAEFLASDKLKNISQSIKAVGVSTNDAAECKANIKVSFTER